MSKGSLQQRHGTWYVVVGYKDEFGKPKQKWISTGLRVNNNKTKAKIEMKKILKNLDLPTQIEQNKEITQDILFVDFLNSYLQVKKQQVEPITINAYTKQASCISNYFKNMRIKLKDLKPYHIEGFYKTLYERGLSGNSVLHYHILIRECLQYAFKNDFVNFNVADKVDRPKTEGYKASFYSIEEIEKLFDCIKDNECKLPIMLTAMYGFRRSEVLGLKWEAIDFENKLVYVKHKIVETRLDGKRYIQMSDKMKTKTSNRTLPLLPQAEELLLKQKALIETNKQMLGKSYNKKYLDYVCVDNLGRLILPNRLTHNFIKIIKRNQLRHIRFHDLRHSCASIMLKNGVPMKQIQEWLGHADFGTTANIYSHLDYTAKQNSANTISSVFNFVDSKDKVEEQPKQEEKDKAEELEEKLARLEEQLRQQQEDEEYQEWLKEKEERKKRKRQSDMEM
ncbi:MAG: site-specific integrase [Firmicutes bacterium]|nr:site-specific integrase [Bacillota bacterium]